MAALPNFGYYYDWDDMNQHGVVEPSWLFSDNFGLAIHPRLGITNGAGLRLSNVPSDTSEHKQKSYDERDKLRREKEKIKNEELEKKQYERLAKKYGKAN